MVRADYSGMGTGTTCDGARSDIFDDCGIQTRAAEDVAPEDFEAGWSQTGAVCMRHARVKENVSLPDLEQLPGFAGSTGRVYTEGFAQEHGAVVFNSSRR